MKFASLAAAAAILLAGAAGPWSQARAFCGFYVGKADGRLFNEASQVIMARDGDRTVLSMQNDFRGDLSAFALVVPVPQLLERDQIRIGDGRLFERIDAWSAPRLVEYFDPDPCRAETRTRRFEKGAAGAPPAAAAEAASDDAALGVRVEARYTVGEYDIVLLSAQQSQGLETWLRTNGYAIPAGAAAALVPYIRQQMHFFVAKVNLAEQAKTGAAMLRPLQFAFESEKFMLPLRLGMLNADGPQDLVVYALTRSGRVESSNYRTIEVPANVDLPVIVRADFGRFYKAMFERRARQEAYRVVFTEHVWDMSWCDPCAADPLTVDELRAAGAFWVGEPPASAPQPRPGSPRARVAPVGGQKVTLTRLHLRYTPESFPEDLMLQVTGDRRNFQSRYVLRHPFEGPRTACAAAEPYYRGVDERRARDARTLASLTGWSLAEIAAAMSLPPAQADPWWRSLWPR
ncbi:MAG: DUF2330 domain-containing protein [Lautropia sp.]